METIKTKLMRDYEKEEKQLIAKNEYLTRVIKQQSKAIKILETQIEKEKGQSLQSRD
jgi:chorismate-pyruvate lyase